MLEKTLEGKLVRGLKARGALVYKFISPGNSGVPDRLVVLPGGRCVFIELKQNKGRLSALQRWQVERLRRQGAEVWIVRGAAEGENVLRALAPLEGGAQDEV